MRRRLLTGVATVAVLVAVGAAVIAARGIGSGPSTPAAAKLPPATATITRQTLVDSQSEPGELGYGESVQVNGKLPGTITALPAQGQTVRRGQPIYRVDNTPVILLYGQLPAYRLLAVGVKGPDVKQLEQNLYALGYRGFTVDETFSATTTTAVKKWQKALGLPQTGVVDLGRIYYTAGPVRVNAQKAAIGDVTGPGMPVLDTTGSQKQVAIELAVAEARLAQLKAAVTLKLPDGTTTPGKIVRVRTAIRPAEGNNPAKTVIKVAVAADDEKALAALDQATIDVDFTAGKRESVLTVPVAALLALAEGGYGVQVVEGSATRIVAVKTGLFAAGRVEITGDGLSDGMTVGMPS